MTIVNFDIDDFNPHAIAENVSKRMRKKRLLLNIAQQSLSEKSGVSLGSIKRFEHKYEISLKHLLRIALVLGSLDEFRQLFPENQYQSVDDIIQNSKVKERQRGRNV
ncbi:MAG: helix-turn-helix transcriptional regulator [Candidatus Marinimicrobia bacterium]|nr:helix-turn-helix transcriptional regulator [Candidatus Neomarinimicrobiota bacterium]